MIVRAGMMLCVLLAGASRAQAYDLGLVGKVDVPLILGVQANSAPTACTISDDGDLIGFLSDATNLVANDQNGVQDAFIDTPGNLFRISRDATGSELPMRTVGMAVSANGQFVAYRTSGYPSLAGISPEWGRIYRLNRSNGNLALVVDLVETGTPNGSLAISNDGRYIAFVTSDDLAAQDADTDDDVYRYDVQSATMLLVSVDLGAAGPSGDAGRFGMDASGNVIAFDSNESDLVPGDTNGARDVFVRDMGAATTLRASVRSNGNEANGASDLLDVSDDGLHIVFSSAATNLDSNLADTNNVVDVYRHSRGTANTRRVSRQSNGDPFTTESRSAAISADGVLVWFVSREGGSTPQLWRKNMANNILLQVTDTIGGMTGAIDIDAAGDDACAVASAYSTDLSADDRNARDDLYRVHVDAGDVITVSREGQPNTPIAAAVTAEASRLLGIDDAGNRLVISAFAPQLDAESFPDLDRSPGRRAYLVDRFSGDTGTPCRNAQGVPSNGSCPVAALSGDGRYVFFASDGTNVHPDVPDAPVNWTQLFRRDLQSGAVELVTRNTSGDPAPNGVYNLRVPWVSADGSRAVFLSSASTLVANDSNGLPDLFLWDAGSGIRRISENNNGNQVNTAYFGTAELSADGNFVVFPHSAGTLVAGDTNGEIDLFLYNVAADTLTRIAQPGAQTTDASTPLDFSADGERLLFRSNAAEFTDPNDEDLFQWNHGSGQVTALSALVSAPSGTLIEPVAFVPGDASGLVFTVATNPDPYRAGPVLYRQYLGGTEPIHAAPITPNIDIADYSFDSPAEADHHGMLVASDQGIFLGHNWPLASSDNNRQFDVAELYAGFGKIEFNLGAIVVAEDAGNIAFEVIRRNGQAFAVNGRVEAQNGSALNGSDFTVAAAGIPIQWGNGVHGSIALNVPILDDAIAEGAESFQLVLSNLGPALPGSVAVLTVTIVDDDSNDVIFVSGFDP